jgi:hypothetical protein
MTERALASSPEPYSQPDDSAMLKAVGYAARHSFSKLKRAASVERQPGCRNWNRQHRLTVTRSVPCCRHRATSQTLRPIPDDCRDTSGCPRGEQAL